MKCLVTGGAGFIGSHIAEELCARGHSVVVLDDLSTGTPENLKWLKPGQKLELIEGCITNGALVRKAMEGCDWVFHHAAVASVPYSVEHPIETHGINLNASLGILNAAKDLGVKRVMFASSSAVYGDSAEPPTPETASINPISPYGLQKYASERYGVQFYQFYGLETVSFRYFNVFGPRQSDNSPYSGVIAKFCRALKAGQQPVIFGDGLQTRDFVYVANIVMANLLAAEAPAKTVAGKVFNLGMGREITLKELFYALQKVAGSRVEPKYEPERRGDIRKSGADIKSARTAMGEFGKIPFDQGLKWTWEFYQ